MALWEEQLRADMSAYVMSEDFENKVYAGVLGKVIGVYLGRPVEGWPFHEIQKQFGLIDTYVNTECQVPLIVADDDISASFTFPRVLSDFGDVTPKSMRETWLTYVLENQTVLWWGGFGRSTEHTALINMKRGIYPPDSGSVATNGTVLPVQIGAQIFYDTFAALFPLDPDKACEISREAAYASHDNIAVDITGYLAALRSLAFRGGTWRELIHAALPWANKNETRGIIVAVSQATLGKTLDDWVPLRNWVDREFGYSRNPGPCPAVSNFALTLLALLIGSTMRESLSIAASAGFDTDSNAGVVGMLCGIKDGLKAVDDSELRGSIADRVLIISGDGGRAVTDAARISWDLIDTARTLADGEFKRQKRSSLDFNLPGSVHGFTECPYLGEKKPVVPHQILADASGGIQIPPNEHGVSISTPVFLDPADHASNFHTIASPCVYTGMTVTADFLCSPGTVAKFYALFNTGEEVKAIWAPSPFDQLKGGEDGISRHRVQVPALENYQPFRIGWRISGTQPTRLRRVEWDENGLDVSLSGKLQRDIWDLEPVELDYWITDAETFEADFDLCIAMAQSTGTAVATIGHDFHNVCIKVDLRLGLHQKVGALVRARGLRHYVAAELNSVRNENVFQLIWRSGDQIEVLDSLPVDVETDQIYNISIIAEEGQVQASLHSEGQFASPLDIVIGADLPNEVMDGGSVGILVAEGACSFDNISISAIEKGENNGKKVEIV